MRSYMHAYRFCTLAPKVKVIKSIDIICSDNAEVLVTMGASLIVTQFVILPFLQRYYSPKVLLQMACVALILAYGIVAFVDSLYHFLVIVAIQTGAYAM